MNTKSIQLNRQRVVSLLLAGLVLAVTIGLAWVDASINQAKEAASSETADIMEYDGGLSPESHLRSIKAGKLPNSGDGFD